MEWDLCIKAKIEGQIIGEGKRRMRKGKRSEKITVVRKDADAKSARKMDRKAERREWEEAEEEG